MLEPMAFSTKLIFDIIKYSSAATSVFLSSLAVYVLFRFYPSGTTVYKNLLVWITVGAALVDFCLQIILDPIVMFPLPCVHIEGVLNKSFKFRASTYLEVWISCMASMAVPYGLCILYRNQLMSENWPDNIRNHTDCFKPDRMYLIVGEYMLVLAGCFLFVFVVCSHTFYTLSQMQIISDKTREYHRRLTKSLIVQ
ncbi:hypothetical protein PENTCL1PPCAC_16614, partial [Pristionchus entomophagus]